MARRTLRLVLAGLIIFGALAARQLALPGAASACSCMPREPDAPVFTGEEQAVFVGTAKAPHADGTFRFAVERWFVGGNAAEVDVQSAMEVFADGQSVINTCGLTFEVGDHLLLSASVSDGVYHPGSCSAHAAVESLEGQRLLAAAIETFGEGARPGQQSIDRDPQEMPDDPDLAGLAIGMVGISVLVVVIAVMAAARRRRDEDAAG